ncbi:MAG TPA: hypothetical protein VK783_02300, partial [Bacteroidia bacterium]|nr:hypothetical protein [Bacteroidia bacterium]
NLINIWKNPNDSTSKLQMGIKEFVSKEYSNCLGKEQLDTLIIDGVTITDYSIIESIETPNKWHYPENISVAYWSKKYGLIAYKYWNGDIWKRINLK